MAFLSFPSLLAGAYLVLRVSLLAHAFVPDHVLRISVDTIQQNCEPRLSTLINGTYPGPPLYLEPDVTTWVRVYNDADVNATIHWHGLSLSTAPYADGSPLASQWPIPPGHFFDYELHPKAFEAGSSFYHSHVGFQAITAAGALIVKDAAEPPYPYDEEIILKLGDYYALEDHEVEDMLTSTEWRWTGDPSALLLNGHSGTGPSQGDDESCSPWQIDVEPGKTYRWRLLGGTALSLVVLGFEDHERLTIIETDNSYVEPLETSFVQAGSGQRLSFLFKAKTQEELDALDGKTSFWIQAETRDSSGPESHVVTAWAKLNYVTNAKTRRQSSDAIPQSPVVELPTEVSDSFEYVFRTLDLEGYGKAPTADEVTRRVVISAKQLLDQSSRHTEFVNNLEAWYDDHPSLGSTTQSPYLVEILSEGTVNNAIPNYERALENKEFPGFDPVSQTYPGQVGEVIELIWQNAAASPSGLYGTHPLHAHGGHFWDMGSGPGLYLPEAHAELLASHSVDGKPWPGSRRDTTSLYKYRDRAANEEDVDGWRVWRFRITEENVGVWMMHCHILQHMIMGQQIVWVFGTPGEIKDHVQPVEGVLDGYFTYGGDVIGKEEQEDQVKRATFFK